jgi:hypothetical protein
MTIPETQWNIHKSHGDKLGECPKPVKMITICLNKKEMTINEKDWSKYAAQGASKGKCPKLVKKIKICHYPPGNKSNPQSIEIPETAWKAHQAHGDTKGECPKPAKMITICLNKKEMSIDEKNWANYAKQGATKGKCPPPVKTPKGNENGPSKKITICHYPPGNKNNPQTIEIPESAWKAHQAHGDTKGGCNSNKKKSTSTKPSKSFSRPTGTIKGGG